MRDTGQLAILTMSDLPSEVEINEVDLNPALIEMVLPVMRKRRMKRLDEKVAIIKGSG